MDTPEKTRPRLFLIDGYALIYRAFFAMISRPLTTSKGENTSAAFGFTRFILKILEDYEPDYLGVVLDSGDSLRTEIFPDYKATREKMPDELRSSLGRIRSLVEAFRIPILELEDHEADDVIGTLAERAAAADVDTVIVSGDKDFYQLIGDRIALLNPGRGGQANVGEEWVDARNAGERLGVPPERVCDYLALIGDSSDNIPGARGIGPKTAIKLIEQYGPVEAILENAASIKGKRARESLQENRDAVLLSKRLVTIMRDLPVELDLEALRVGEPDRDRLKQLFAELEFHGLVREIAAPEPETARLDADYRAIESTAGVRDVVARARERGSVSLYALGSSPDGPMRAELVGLALGLGPGDAAYFPLTHRTPSEVLDLGLDDGTDPAVPEAAAGNLPALPSSEMKPLRELLEDGAIEKTGHDLKYALVVLRRAGIELRGLSFDTMIASYLIEPGRRDQELGSLALQHFGHSAMAYEDLCGKGRAITPVAECGIEAVRDYACEKADLTDRLRDRLEPQLGEYHLESLFRDIEMPLVEVLADMEQAGIRIDVEFFRGVSKRLERDLSQIQQDIWKEAGEEFNISSTPQLREVLFDRLELPVLKKTKTGPSTDASVLEELAAQGHRLPTLLLEYRQLDKLRSTYVDALPILVNPRTGRIHTTFNQAVSATGRLSSTDPNLQNIPIRTDVGAQLRKGFLPRDGCVFLSADYSQIELRVLAHLSGDATFVDAFRSGADIHKRTAGLVFGVPEDDVTPRMRDAAKTINFATIYGIGPFALSKQLGTTVAEAKTFIESYFERLPDVRKYLDRQIERAYEDGYVETLVGRRRYIPEVRSKNYNIRQFGERAATNAPVQGSAADIIKIAMNRIAEALRERADGTRMLLQVHDELLFEVPEGAVEEVTALVSGRMEAAFELNVPLKVATGFGASWYDCK